MDPGRSTANSLCYCCTTLINWKFIAVQTLRSGHAGPWESESYPTSSNMSVKWRVGTSTRVSINSNRKTRIENCVMSTDTHEQEMRHQVKYMWQNQLYEPKL